jgi:hypothetical protein
VPGPGILSKLGEHKVEVLWVIRENRSGRGADNAWPESILDHDRTPHCSAIARLEESAGEEGIGASRVAEPHPRDCRRARPLQDD